VRSRLARAHACRRMRLSGRRSRTCGLPSEPPWRRTSPKPHHAPCPRPALGAQPSPRPSGRGARPPWSRATSRCDDPAPADRTRRYSPATAPPRSRLSKFATTLKDEIIRLGRKEAKRLALPLKHRITALERLVRQQRLAMAQLSKQAVAASKAVVATPAAAATSDRDQSRLGPRSIKAQRKRLRLSQVEFAKLAGVTHVAVYLWESGRTKPRGRNREALLKLRGLGVRDARQQLDGTASTRQSRKPQRRTKVSAPKRAGSSYQRAVAATLRRRRDT